MRKGPTTLGQSNQSTKQNTKNLNESLRETEHINWICSEKCRAIGKDSVRYKIQDLQETLCIVGIND